MLLVILRSLALILFLLATTYVVAWGISRNLDNPY